MTYPDLTNAMNRMARLKQKKMKKNLRRKELKEALELSLKAIDELLFEVPNTEDFLK